MCNCRYLIKKVGRYEFDYRVRCKAHAYDGMLKELDEKSKLVFDNIEHVRLYPNTPAYSSSS